MTITTLTLDRVKAISVHALGLDAERFSLESPEAIAASIRRAASFLCPTDPRTLVDSAIEVLAPLQSELPKREDLMELLEQIVSTGDLIELTTATYGRQSRLLYLGPPSFIEKAPGQYLVTGVRPEAVPLLSEDFKIDYVRHTRSVSLDPGSAEAQLRASGLHKITLSKWVGQPSVLSAPEYVGQFNQRLSVARTAGAVEGLSIIDPSTRVDYYRGRWRSPASGDNGAFVGRRPQAYGADLWCIVRLLNGVPERLIDLPLDGGPGPARDDAWRLQAAIDAVNSGPPCYRVYRSTDASSDALVVDFFSPLPTWTERHLGLVGNATNRSRGALFTYLVPATAMAELQSVLAETLWMSEIAEGRS